MDVEIRFNGVLKPCTKEVDGNNEVVFTSEDGDFIKFPNSDNLEDLIESYNSVNEVEHEVIGDITYGKVEINNFSD